MRFYRVWLIAVVGCAGSASAAEPVEEFLRVVPGDANSVMVVRVRELLSSPRGLREGWAEKGQDAFLEGTQQIPPWVSVVYRANRLRPEESGVVWSVGVAGAPPDVSLAQIAEQQHSVIDSLGGTQFVQGSRGAFAMLLSPGVVGIYSPGYRQDFARWLRFVKVNTKPQLSPYLADSVRSSAHISMAFDLEHVFPPQMVFAWLQHSSAMKGKTAETPAVSALLQGIRGVRLEAMVEDETAGRVVIDFTTPVGPHAQTVKAVLLEFLEHSGAVIDDLEAATVSADANSVVLTTKVSDDGLRRALSMITSPNPLTRLSTGKTAPEAPRSQGNVAASRRYYTGVNKLVDDLSNRHRRAKNYEKTAVWHENFARKIEEMSIDGVHPELARYGQEAALRFKALAASLRGGQLEVATIGNTLTYNVRVDPGFGGVNVWGGVGWQPPSWEATSNLQQVRERQAEAVLRGAAERDQLWTQIEADRKAIRLKMQEVYQQDFDTKEKP